jgi:hypothetical protein
MSNQPYEGPYEGSYQGSTPYQQPPQGHGQPQQGHGQQQPQQGRWQYQESPQAYQEPQQYAQHQQYPQHSQGAQGAQGAQGEAWGWTGQGTASAPAAPPAFEEPPVTEQTQEWAGQTWESQPQPQVAPQASLAETSYLPPVPDQAAETAYLPPVRADRPVPDHAAETAYLPPVAAEPASGPEPGPGRRRRNTGAPTDAAAASAVDVSAYGPPTMAGNSRVTDAQRARAEGRSPIIEPGMQPAALTAALGLLLAVAAALGSFALFVPLVVLQGVTAAGWFRLNGMWPARQGIALAFAGAFVADVVVLAAGRDNGLAAVLGSLGVWVLLTLVVQLRSHADPDTRTQALVASVASAALAVLAAGCLAAVPDAVTVGALAVAVGVVVRALPLPTPASVGASLVAGLAAGAVVGGMTDLGMSGAWLGLGAVACALVGHRVSSYDYPSRFVHFTAGVSLPLATAVPAVYVLGAALT